MSSRSKPTDVPSTDARAVEHARRLTRRERVDRGLGLGRVDRDEPVGRRLGGVDADAVLGDVPAERGDHPERARIGAARLDHLRDRVGHVVVARATGVRRGRRSR